jgi:nucleoside-diphosphate-sugar epimerase
MAKDFSASVAQDLCGPSAQDFVGLNAQDCAGPVASEALIVRIPVATEWIGELPLDATSLYGDGRRTSSFCYVEDLIDGIVRLMATADGRPPGS